MRGKIVFPCPEVEGCEIRHDCSQQLSAVNECINRCINQGVCAGKRWNPQLSSIHEKYQHDRTNNCKSSWILVHSDANECKILVNFVEYRKTFQEWL